MELVPLTRWDVRRNDGLYPVPPGHFSVEINSHTSRHLILAPLRRDFFYSKPLSSFAAGFVVDVCWKIAGS
jgi:hypothetical protein